MTPIDQCSFEQLVGEALDSLPAELGKLMDNVAIVVEDRHHEMGLLGIYEGIPLTERDNYGYMATPDLITLYRLAHCEAVDSLDELIEQIKITVVHEVAHHFGIDDDRLGEWGWG